MVEIAIWNQTNETLTEFKKPPNASDTTVISFNHLKNIKIERNGSKARMHKNRTTAHENSDSIVTEKQNFSDYLIEENSLAAPAKSTKHNGARLSALKQGGCRANRKKLGFPLKGTQNKSVGVQDSIKIEEFTGK